MRFRKNLKRFDLQNWYKVFSFNTYFFFLDERRLRNAANENDFETGNNYEYN